MKNKEKLERAGWLYKCTWGNHDEYEVYGRGTIRIVYDPSRDKPLAFYDTKERHDNELCLVTDLRFEIFCEPLIQKK